MAAAEREWGSIDFRERNLLKLVAEIAKGAASILTKSELCVPIKIEEETIGGINVESDFNGVDVLALEALGDQLAMAIRNAGLYQELRDRAIEMITMLARVTEERDAYTEEHCEQVARLAEAILKG